MQAKTLTGRGVGVYVMLKTQDNEIINIKTVGLNNVKYLRLKLQFG